MFHGGGLELHDIDIGKRYKGFVRQRPSNPLEPLYPTEPEETPEISEFYSSFREMIPDIFFNLNGSIVMVILFVFELYALF